MAQQEIVAIIHSHHLLDHKPDNLLLKGAKYKLRGVACLGRPGVAVCVGHSAFVDNFQMSLEDAMPQKKFGRIVLEMEAPLSGLEGFDAVSLGELRTLLESWGQEEHFFALTGIDPAQATNSTSSGSKSANNKSGKRGKGKKKR